MFVKALEVLMLVNVACAATALRGTVRPGPMRLIYRRTFAAVMGVDLAAVTLSICILLVR